MMSIKVNFQGRDFDAERVEVSQATERWNEYLLEDRSTLKLKPVVTEVKRLIGQYDNEGNPIYIVTASNVVAASSPESLRKK